MKKIVVLGSTGSIGLQTLDILKYNYDYKLVGITFNSNFEKIESYLPYFPYLKYVGIVNVDAYKAFIKKYKSYKVFVAEKANEEVIEASKAKFVFNSILGNDGLLPSLYAIKNNLILFLSNKESLVIGGSLIIEELKKSKSVIYPVDSEHVALSKLINQVSSLKMNNLIEKYYITASGGALRDYPLSKLDSVNPSDVLNHPTWNMGNKITIDSATLVNKAYEIIEASILFNLDINNIDALICRSSLIHGLIKLKDKSLIEYSPVDMKVAISYALSMGKLKVHKNNLEDKKNISKTKLENINHDFYPCFDLTLNMYKKYKEIGMIYFNALDTSLISAFLNNEIKYTDIYLGLKYLYDNFNSSEILSIDNIKDIEIKAINVAKEIVNNKKYKL